MIGTRNKIKWKDGKKFAFTFCDDTDFATLENVRPIYDLLEDLGLRTTKLVWLSEGDLTGKNAGDTCENREYADWLVSIKNKGFEIGIHNVASSSSTRQQIETGIEKYKLLFGSFPRVHCNHTGCLDNLYWGDARLSGWRRLLYKYWVRNKNGGSSLGHLEHDPHFWGDICRKNIQYVRNFTFDSVNTLRCCPQMPYHDTSKPYVNYWFAATNASSPKYFRQNFSLESIDELVEDGGLCIAYVHFGTGFYREGRFDDHFLTIANYISRQNGWFAPVSEILDFIRHAQTSDPREISTFDRQRLELRWMVDKLGKKTGI
jgi:hypothetical protein